MKTIINRYKKNSVEYYSHIFRCSMIAMKSSTEMCIAVHYILSCNNNIRYTTATATISNHIGRFYDIDQKYTKTSAHTLYGTFKYQLCLFMYNVLCCFRNIDNRLKQLYCYIMYVGGTANICHSLDILLMDVCVLVFCSLRGVDELQIIIHYYHRHTQQRPHTGGLSW